mmetsp:Transcript_25561/g.54305  ORF Transcript_25561/g.54305 Transcript_25561/m.54305 type:complete len:349 (+) Transcript_25561:644-1690(+)
MTPVQSPCSISASKLKSLSGEPPEERRLLLNAGDWEMASLNRATSSMDNSPTDWSDMRCAAAPTACQLPASMACSSSDLVELTEVTLWELDPLDPALPLPMALLLPIPDWDRECWDMLLFGLALALASSLALFCTASRALLAMARSCILLKVSTSSSSLPLNWVIISSMLSASSGTTRRTSASTSARISACPLWLLRLEALVLSVVAMLRGVVAEVAEPVHLLEDCDVPDAEKELSPSNVWSASNLAAASTTPCQSPASTSLSISTALAWSSDAPTMLELLREPLFPVLSPSVDFVMDMFAAFVGELRRWLPCPWLANTAARAPTCPQLPASMALSRSSMAEGADRVG